MKSFKLFFILLVLAGLVFTTNGYSANDLYENANCSLATVDTDPAVSYYTGTIEMNSDVPKKYGRMFFVCYGTGVMVVTLEKKRSDETTWTTVGEYTAPFEEQIIEGGAPGRQWRAVVYNGDYVSGETVFGFEWE